MTDQQLIKKADDIKKELTSEEILILIKYLEAEKILKEASQVASGNFNLSSAKCPTCGKPY